MQMIQQFHGQTLFAIVGKVALICLMCISCGCLRDKAIIPFDHLYSYIEVAKGEKGETEFRAYTKPDSFMPIGDFVLVSSTDEVRNVSLTLFWTREKNIAVSEDDETGILIHVPDVAFDLSAKYWYRDKQGRYPIVIGTAQSWREHLEKWRPRLFDADWKHKLEEDDRPHVSTSDK